MLHQRVIFSVVLSNLSVNIRGSWLEKSVKMSAAIIDLAMGMGLDNTIGFFAPILLGIVNLVPTLLSLFFYADKSSEFKKSTTIAPEVPFNPDFIIVGGGTAGSVLANHGLLATHRNRLSSKRFSVLVLERGGEPNPLTLVPGMQQAMLDNYETDYRYLTVPQNNSCFSCIGRQTFQNAGFGLGGNSMNNGLVFIRGHPFDYDRWAKVTNDERWNYKNMLPFLLRMEGFCSNCENTPGVKPQINPIYHNRDGEISARPLPYTPLVPEFLSALEWSGVQNADLNAPYYNETVDVHVNNAKRGRRVSAYHAYLKPLLGKSPFLKAIKYARVIEIVFKPGTNQAVGVKYERFGEIETVRATKEVIVSAGTIESPKLLLLSGIGPAQDLRAFNITLRSNLPVGRNFQNHVNTLIGPFLIDKSLSMLADRDLNQQTAQEYLKNGTGPFSVTSARAHALLISSLAIQEGEEQWPDIKVNFLSNGVPKAVDSDLARRNNFRPDLLREFFQPIKGRDAFIFNVNAGRPKSRGVISLKSKDYKDDPLIDPRYYSDPEQHDLQVTVEGIQRMVHIAENAPSFKSLGAKLNPTAYPACAHVPFRSDDYWKCFVTHLSLHVHHFSGTNSMGRTGSPEAVVTSELKVIGTTGLRVVDASVQPFVVSTNSFASVVAIAERAADFIIQEYRH